MVEGAPEALTDKRGTACRGLITDRPLSAKSNFLKASPEHGDAREFESATMLYIHPSECIDCGACEPACPVTAIFPEDNVPEQWQHYIAMNYEHYGLSK